LKKEGLVTVFFSLQKGAVSVRSAQFGKSPAFLCMVLVAHKAGFRKKRTLIE
jgi:hypothetical protein